MALGPLTAHASVIDEVNTKVNHTRSYGKYHSLPSEGRYLAPGEVGNCVDFAFTKQVELEKRGIKSLIGACYLKNGQAHAWLIVIDPVTHKRVILDNRFDRVVNYAEVGCE